MPANIQQIIKPTSVEEAVRSLAEGGGARRAIAGGTASSLFKAREITGLVDLWSLPLRYIRAADGQLRIGATTTLADLVRSDAVAAWAGGALATAAAAAASTPLRNMITVGGNLAGLYPWSDLPPVLLVLDAVAKIAGPAGPELAVAELVASHPSRVLGSASLITEIVLPAQPAGTATAFVKFAESAVDYSWLDIAVLVEMHGKVCRRCRVAVGAIESRCRRLPEVEALLVGAELDETTATAAAQRAAEVVKPLPDHRSGQRYRSDLLRTLCRRVLLAARDQSRPPGGGGS